MGLSHESTWWYCTGCGERWPQEWPRYRFGPGLNHCTDCHDQKISEWWVRRAEEELRRLG